MINDHKSSPYLEFYLKWNIVSNWVEVSFFYWPKCLPYVLEITKGFLSSIYVPYTVLQSLKCNNLCKTKTLTLSISGITTAARLPLQIHNHNVFLCEYKNKFLFFCHYSQFNNFSYIWVHIIMWNKNNFQSYFYTRT